MNQLHNLQASTKFRNRRQSQRMRGGEACEEVGVATAMSPSCNRIALQACQHVFRLTLVKSECWTLMSSTRISCIPSSSALLRSASRRLPSALRWKRWMLAPRPVSSGTRNMPSKISWKTTVLSLVAVAMGSDAICELLKPLAFREPPRLSTSQPIQQLRVLVVPWCLENDCRAKSKGVLDRDLGSTRTLPHLAACSTTI